MGESCARKLEAGMLGMKMRRLGVDEEEGGNIWRDSDYKALMFGILRQRII